MSDHTFTHRLERERGIALITTMLVMLLMSALMIGFVAIVMSDQKARFIDKDRSQSFYAAQSGLEKLNGDLQTLFFQNVAPSPAQISGLSAAPPVIDRVSFVDSTGDPAYNVTEIPAPAGTPAFTTVTTGPYQGLYALKRTYELNASARTSSGGETHLKRKVETVAIPVFQFGIFSSVDLSFSAADNFNFGGRIHTNANLFLAQGGDSSDALTISDRVTAFGEIVRQRLSNGVSIDSSGSTQKVDMVRAPNSFRALARTEGSVVDGIGSAQNGAWTSLSTSTYNSYIRNRRTGATALNLPLVTTGGANIDLVRRPAANENVNNPTLLGERYFSKTSIRILLSDTAQNILSLPSVTATQPVLLDGDWVGAPPAGYGPVAANRPPVARSPGMLAALTISPAVPTNVGGNAVITLSAPVPAALKLTTLRVKNPGVTAVTCTGKTATTFTGCVPATAAVPAGTTLEGDVTVIGTLPTETETVSMPVSTWAGGTITVTGGIFPTARYAANTFWAHNPDNTNVLVTCTGYNATTSLTGCTVPQAITNGAGFTTAALTTAGTGLLGGYLKVEVQDKTTRVWRDITLEVLNHGFANRNLDGKQCVDPTPNAIIRLQRLRDNSEPGVPGTACTYPNSRRSTDYWPNALFDTREGVYRDTNTGNLVELGGVMHYVELDVANLSEWFAGTGVYAGGSGTSAWRDNNGFSVYFSDRRNNRNATGLETGEFGFEDVVNPASGAGVPNNSFDAGEDMNGNGLLETYGQFPSYNGNYNTLPPGAVAPFNVNVRPTTQIRSSEARVNRQIFFRRALKLTKGSLGNIIAPGLTVAAENPIYIQGDWNANQAGFGDPHVATSVAADAVTLLSNIWDDNNSFDSPHATSGRRRGGDTYYRVAVIAGKGPIFPQPPGAGATFGTDGGAHSFLRFLEGSAAAGNNRINYRGSLIAFYYDRQAVSPFKCCGSVVYDVPSRDYVFDLEFLDPALLPPLTPVFRDMNALGFTQENRPGR